MCSHTLPQHVKPSTVCRSTVLDWRLLSLCLQTNVSFKTVPMPIRDLREYRVVDMAMGPTHTAVLVSSGRVFTFGRNMEGQLGTGHVTISSMVTKTQALQEKAMVRVCGGRGHTGRESS